jgi:hypothetical protein
VQGEELRLEVDKLRSLISIWQWTFYSTMEEKPSLGLWSKRRETMMEILLVIHTQIHW